MSVSLSWHEPGAETAGMAIYTTESTRYAVTLPSFEEAQRLEQILCSIFADGRRMGHREMMQATSAAMNEVGRLL